MSEEEILPLVYNKNYRHLCLITNTAVNLEYEIQPLSGVRNIALYLELEILSIF